MPNPQISAVDYNSIRNKIVGVLGSGIGSSGYGQSVTSSAVSQGEIISKIQWDNLADDLRSIKMHQDGTEPVLTSILPLDVIQQGITLPYTSYDTVIDAATVTKFNIGTTQSVITAKPGTSRTGSWGSQSYCEITVTFGSADEARYFFNSGGKIRVSSTRTGGASTPQNNSWTNLLNTIGIQSFGANTPGAATFYSLTDTYQTFYQQSSTSSYSSNNYQLQAKSNVTNNVGGTATVVYIKVIWNDAYIDPDTLNPDYPGGVSVHPPGDTVDGTLAVIVEELKAAGSLYPVGTFTIISPSFAISAITAT
jgi:hypothetical protein